VNSRAITALAAIELHGNQQQEALELLEHSVNIAPDPGNPAVESLGDYCIANGGGQRLKALHRRAPASARLGSGLLGRRFLADGGQAYPDGGYRGRSLRVQSRRGRRFQCAREGVSSAR